jgi:hypothetical protein
MVKHIQRLLRHSVDHYRVHNSPQLFPILSEMNPVLLRSVLILSSYQRRVSQVFSQFPYQNSESISTSYA